LDEPESRTLLDFENHLILSASDFKVALEQFVNGVTTDRPPMQGVKDLWECLYRIGLHAQPGFGLVSGAAKHPSGA
jgi:hypothetical protein